MMTSHSSRLCLSAPIALIASFLFAASATAQSSSQPTLKDAYKRHFYVGVAINRSIVTGQAPGFAPRSGAQVSKDIALTKAQFNQISPENDLKWESIHPGKGTDGYNFGPADAYVDFGVKNHMYIVGHTLVWHGQTPDWVFAGTVPPPETKNPGRQWGYTGPRATREELLQKMHDHISTVVRRYKGKIKVWDVVNECIADGGPNPLRNSLWLQIIGPDFIAKAFEYAHEADPQAILRLNDYGLEDPAKRQRFIALVKQLQAQKVPVMAIGTQTHVSVSSPSSEAEDQTLTDLETLGLPVHVTELDVNSAESGQNNSGADVANNGAATQGGLVDKANQRLAAQYAALFQVFLKHTQVKVVTFWGVNDGVSWRSDGKPLLFDSSDQPKPAFGAVLRAARGSKAQN